MRAFLAFPLPDPLARKLARIGAEIKGLRAQKASTIHLTLRFLSEIQEPESVVAAARETAGLHDPFALEVKGLGVFPHARRARVLWAGLGTGAEQVAALVVDLGRFLTAAGIRQERRPWHGHVTLGRFKRPSAVAADLLEPGQDFGQVQAETIVLYRSILTPDGAVHERVSELSLGRGN